jgi:hypothetical protein
MKSTFLKFFVFGLLTLGAVSCTQPDSVENETTLFSTGGDDGEVNDDRGGDN